MTSQPKSIKLEIETDTLIPMTTMSSTNLAVAPIKQEYFSPKVCKTCGNWMFDDKHVHGQDEDLV